MQTFSEFIDARYPHLRKDYEAWCKDQERQPKPIREQRTFSLCPRPFGSTREMPDTGRVRPKAERLQGYRSMSSDILHELTEQYCTPEVQDEFKRRYRKHRFATVPQTYLGDKMLLGPTEEL